MSDIEQVATDASEQRRQQMLSSLNSIEGSVAQIAASLKLLQGQREQCQAFVKMVLSLDIEKREPYADQVRQWREWAEARAKISAQVVQNVESLRNGLEGLVASVKARSEAPHPPWLGEFLICLLVPLDRQDDRLGDFAERFQLKWLPRFGPRLAGVVYVAQVLWYPAVAAKIRMVAAIADFIVSLLDR